MAPDVAGDFSKALHGNKASSSPQSPSPSAYSAMDDVSSEGTTRGRTMNALGLLLNASLFTNRHTVRRLSVMNSIFERTHKRMNERMNPSIRRSNPWLLSINQMNE